MATTHNKTIKTLRYSVSAPFANYSSEVADKLSASIYYCDAYYYVSGNVPLSMNVGNPGYGSGAYNCQFYINWTGTAAVRLCYRPISN